MQLNIRCDGKFCKVLKFWRHSIVVYESVPVLNINVTSHRCGGAGSATVYMAHGLMEIIFTSAGTKVSNTELFLRKIKTPRLFICHSANGKHEKLGENPSKKSWKRNTFKFQGRNKDCTCSIIFSRVLTLLEIGSCTTFERLKHRIMTCNLSPGNCKASTNEG